MKKSKLRVILMDDTTGEHFDEGGLRAVRRAEDKYGDCSYEIITRTFETEAERKAYIDALYDITIGCYTTYAILNSR